jgi:2-dehydropantoate 2-reductase
MTASILCLITGHRATVVQDERIGPVFLRLAAEAVSVANAHGISTEGFDAEAARQNVPNHFPSIRQDYDRGKPLEVDSLVVLPVEFGRAAGLDIPCLELLAALAVRKARDVEEGIAGRD